MNTKHENNYKFIFRYEIFSVFTGFKYICHDYNNLMILNNYMYVINFEVINGFFI